MVKVKMPKSASRVARMADMAGRLSLQCRVVRWVEGWL